MKDRKIVSSNPPPPSLSSPFLKTEILLTKERGDVKEVNFYMLSFICNLS